jgi:hypothetical protein
MDGSVNMSFTVKVIDFLQDNDSEMYPQCVSMEGNTKELFNDLRKMRYGTIPSAPVSIPFTPTGKPNLVLQ